MARRSCRVGFVIWDTKHNLVARTDAKTAPRIFSAVGYAQGRINREINAKNKRARHWVVEPVFIEPTLVMEVTPT